MDRFNIDDFKEAARQYLPKDVFDYIAGGAGDEITVLENYSAYQRIQLLPRVLNCVDTIDTEIKLFGQKIDLPILVAPTGFQALVHSEGELATLKAACELNTIMICSTSATTSIEEIATMKEKVAGKSQNKGALWFQHSILQEMQITVDLIKRAEQAAAWRSLSPLTHRS